MTISISEQLSKGSNILHEQHGNGIVILDNGETVVIRFQHGIEECDKKTLNRVFSPEEKLRLQTFDSTSDVVCRIQAECIDSINDVWGTFSRSRIALLPHQLWVCRKVLERWPTRWLIADDVGLGKTIEAGLILLPLLTQKKVNRLLILSPASLVDQWRERMYSMFDIRLTPYSPDLDRGKVPFWEAHSQVIASFHTLREDRNGRHKRMFDASRWDLLIVDEAHHLNADEASGPTLGYRLVKQLEERKLLESIVFFTGTPHRGRDFGFLSLLKLLNDEFDPKQSITEQCSMLRNVMIRNNKLSVTDMKGAPLFKRPIVFSETYQYSHEEENFYERMTDFIANGQAYASKLGTVQGTAVMLTLIAMQKLASSSIAAIKKAIRGRLAKIRKQGITDNIPIAYPDADDDYEDNFDADSYETEVRPETTVFSLMEEETARLETLLDLAERISTETKVSKILTIVDERFHGESILFFTEYKATQALLFSQLAEKYGRGQVGFINGDERLEGVMIDGHLLPPVSMSRTQAAQDFNEGKFRFLISTEAAGEGIDLQEKCHSLVHVDLPWNPMRLHQRVGRLNRYGQKNQVQIVTLRNPATIESRIWDILNNKLNTIMNAFGPVMDEPEDLLQLVLGMTSNRLFDEIFSEAARNPKGTLSQWFDKKTSRLGNQDAIQTVKNLVGHCEKFDFNKVSREAPQVDLPDLKVFFCRMLSKHQRRVSIGDDMISFKTPEAWLKTPGMRLDYHEMSFRRDILSKEGIQKILGVGHKVFDRAVAEGKKIQSCIALVPRKVINNSLFIFRIQDRLTGQNTRVQSVCLGAEIAEGIPYIRRDWEILKIFNHPDAAKDISNPGHFPLLTQNQLNIARKSIETWIRTNYLPFKIPQVEFLALLIPDEGK